MKRGNLILYDNEGKVWYESGEAEGDILPHVYPVGVPYIEFPYGFMNRKRIVGVDISTVPHTPIIEDLPYVESTEEKLQRELLEAQEQIVQMEFEKLVGGI